MSEVRTQSNIKSGRLIKSASSWVMAVGLVIAVALYGPGILILHPKISQAEAATFITSGSSWTVPADWNNNNNTIEVIGGGGGGGGGAASQGGSGSGGGGGGYAKATNVSLPAGQPVTIALGGGGTGGSAGNAGTSGGSTYVCNTNSGCTSVNSAAVVVGANGGQNGTVSGGAGGSGGTAVVGTGFSGGGGGSGGTGGSNAGGGGGGGGGAGGPSAGGNAGTNNSGSSTGSTGGQGDGTAGGAGGSSGVSGSAGTEWDATHGAGGGGGGGSGGGRNASGGSGGVGGQYGAGGGGGGSGGKGTTSGGPAGNGTAGLIVINYQPLHNYTQAAYVWFANTDSATPSAALAGNNTAYNLTGTGQQFRLRLLLRSSGTDTASYQSFNLQYAPLSSYGACSSVPGANFANVTTSTAISYYNNPTPADGAATSAATGDPTDSTQTVVTQTYEEANSFTNTSTYGGTSDGLWDFSLYDNGAPSNTSYCFRVTDSSGNAISTYTVYPEITTYSTGPTTDQLLRGGEWFNGGSKQPFFWAQ